MHTLFFGYLLYPNIGGKIIGKKYYIVYYYFG